MLKRIRFFITSWLLLCVFLISGCGTTQTTSQTKYSLSLEKTTYNLLDGEQAALRINFTADGKEADWALLTFESDNESVATVSEEGKITAVSEGTANVTVTHAEKSVTATVKVRMRFRDLVLSKEKLTLQRVHQDGRSERTVRNLRGVRHHNVGHRQPADTLNR